MMGRNSTNAAVWAVWTALVAWAAGALAPASAVAQVREFDPVKLNLPKCQAAGLNQRMMLTTIDRKSGRTLTNKELVADQVSVEVVVGKTITPAPLTGDTFDCRISLPNEPGEHQVMVRLKTPAKSVDGVWSTLVTRPNTQLKAANLDLGQVQGGCTHSDTCNLDKNCKPLDLKKDSQGLYKGLALKVVRQAGSWPEAHMVLRGAGDDRVLERDKPIELAWDPTQTWQVCASHPRCTPPPAKAEELVQITPVDECLDVMKKEHGVTDRSVKLTVQAAVQPNTWLDCNLWWILIVAGVLLAIFILYGLLSPAQFPQAAMLRVANNQRQLAREPGRPLRREPQGKRGFYRTATVCFSDIGTTVKRSQGHVLQLKAEKGKQIAVMTKGTQLERWERNTWKVVVTTDSKQAAPSPNTLVERTLVSGGVYRVGGQWFFTVDF